jgi:hypothetical protein
MNNEITITTIDEVINQLGNHTGAWIFDENGKISDDVIAIDTRDLLQEFKPFEVDADEAKQICENLIADGNNTFSDFWGFTFSNIATQSDNTYNWGSILSHDLNFNEFEYNDEKFVAIMVHLGGDIRGNYSHYFLLRCSFEDLFEIEFYNTVEVGDYYADLRWYDDSYEVYNSKTDEYIGTFYESEISNLIEEIKNYIA